MIRRTCLHSAHQSAGARLVPFAGYEMPVQYTSIMAEAKAVRDSVGMFDVSHMARLEFTGSGVEPMLERTTTNDVSAIPADGGQYSLLPNERGGCIDDIIVYRLPDRFYLVVNASNHEKDLGWLNSHKSPGVSIRDETDDTAMIAVQGPDSEAVLSKLAGGRSLSEVPTFGVLTDSFAGVTARAARSGYTGEDGFELICAAAGGEQLWDALLEVGVTPCGLGSRDTLRVEAGFPLYGHELSDDLSPIAAGLGWVISKTKTFIGSGPINEAREHGTLTRLVGIKLDSKRLTTPGMRVLVNGEEAGQVTSGIISPTFDTALALAFIKREISLGTRCEVETRGKPEGGTIVGKRFYKRVKD